MLNLKTDGLSPMQIGRLDKALDKPVCFEGVAMTWREKLLFMAASGGLEKTESDGMLDYSRTKFNRMDYRQQDAYTAMLRARRYYYVAGWIVPKIIYDAV